MADLKTHDSSELESREVAESSRQTEWEQPSFMRELFLGDFRMDLLHPFPMEHKEESEEFKQFYAAMRDFLMEKVDPVEIDATGEYPEEVLDGLRKLGAFGMKISKEYGGLGLTQVEYGKVMQLLGSREGNLSALLSAHQSIGVPNPLKHFGTEELKRKYLPRCAAGEISAFALTESDVGSDPARLATTAELTPEGDAYILNGEKLWCTNGTIAGLLVVMARNPETKKISAFVVETDWDGVDVVMRSRFMGLKALANAVIRFTDVRVPRENLIGQEGKGLKIALTTLNDGRLSIPSICVGTTKSCLEICRTWGNERVQWGLPVGRHEAIGHKITKMAATTFAMESIALLASAMSDRGNYDIRLEAAAAKEWNTEWGWRIVDDTMQIRGGRGYETEQSLAARGDKPIGVERMMRDFRINRIFEGSSEIMHLFMAREAVDKHLQVAGAMIDPKTPIGQKLSALPGIIGFYVKWYATRWFGWGFWPRHSEFGRLGTHMRFIDRASRKLARQVFHGMMIHQAKLQYRQAFLFRAVDNANDLFAMAASASRAHAMRTKRSENAKEAVELADVFCRAARRRVKQRFHDMWHNDDRRQYRTAGRILDGDHLWMEQGIVGIEEALAAQRAQPGVSPTETPAHQSEEVPTVVTA